MAISRRQFVKTSALTVGAASLPLSAWSHAAGANERIRVAVIGTRGRGRGLMGGFAKHLVAICDCDQEILDARAASFDKQHGTTLAKYTDYRKLVESPDIDAVVIATPNHTHALIGIEAMQAGKDVYVEKPCSHNVWEGRQLVNAARKNDRICQIGTQSRSDNAIRQAVEYVQGGKLGKLQYVIGTCYKPRKSIGKLDQPLQIPSHVDYDLWCGPAPKVDLFRPQLHYDWHWDFNTGCGDMGNQGVHQMDVARWFVGEAGLPRRVMSVGGRLGYEDAADTPNTEVSFYDFETAPLIFETRGLPSSKEAQSNWGRSMDAYRGLRIGVLAQCENGYARDGTVFDNDDQLVERFSGGGSHAANFLKAVRSRKLSDLNAEILEGHVSSSLCHLGQLSYQIGEKATAREIGDKIGAQPQLADSFDRMAEHLRANEIDIDSSTLTLGPWLEVDSESEQITNNPQANGLMTREYRAPFVVPDLSA